LKQPNDKFMSRQTAGTAGAPGQQGVVYNAPINPFHTAFVVPNPTVPVQKPQPTADELAEMDVSRFNTRNPYNLLKHPGKWTLVVKAYRTPTQTSGIETHGVFERAPNAANAARMLEGMGKAAEQLAGILRSQQLNFDA